MQTVIIVIYQYFVMKQTIIFYDNLVTFLTSLLFACERIPIGNVYNSNRGLLCCVRRHAYIMSSASRVSLFTNINILQSLLDSDNIFIYNIFRSVFQNN